MPIAWPPPASGPGVPDRGGAVPQPRVYAQGDPYLALPMQVPGDGGEYGDGSRWTPTSGPPAGWNGAPARRLLVNLPGVDRPAAGSFVNHRAVLAVTQPPSLAGRPEQRPGAPSPRQWRSSLAGEGSPLRLFPLCSYPPSRRPAGLGFGSWPFAPPVECAGLWRGISLLREKMIAAK